MKNTAYTPTKTKAGRASKERNADGRLNMAELKRRFLALRAEQEAAAAPKAEMEIVKYGSSKWSVEGFPQMFPTRAAAEAHVELALSVRAMKAVAA